MSFSHLVTAFFQKYLAAECGLATNSIASYSDCIKLLINFACTRFDVQPEELSIDQFDRELIIEFLDDLERNRQNGASTRNQRLAAIKTFFHFLAYNVPELMHLNETIQAIRQKKTDHTPPPSMTIEEVEAIAAVPDPRRLIGARDKALVKLMYNRARPKSAYSLFIGLSEGKIPAKRGIFASFAGKRCLIFLEDQNQEV